MKQQSISEETGLLLKSKFVNMLTSLPSDDSQISKFMIRMFLLCASELLSP